MNTGNRIAALFILLMLPVFSVIAEESTISFVIAPPPAGYPIFEERTSETTLGISGVFTDLKSGGTSFKIYGPVFFANYQYNVTDWFALSNSIGAAILAGNKHSLFMIQIPMQINAVFEVLKSAEHSFFLIGGAGGDIGSTKMKSTLPLTAAITTIDDEVTYSTFTTTGRFTGGAQANLGMGNLIFSPFGLYTWTAGTYSTTLTSSMSESYPSSSGSIPGYSSAVFGFDMLYLPSGVSLSSFIHNTDKYMLISLALRWALNGPKQQQPEG